MKPERIAAEAARLKQDPVLLLALRQMRIEALEALATANPDDRNTLIYSQAYARLCEELPDKLDAFVLAHPGDDEDSPV